MFPAESKKSTFVAQASTAGKSHMGIEPYLRAGLVMVMAGPAADRKLASRNDLHRTALHESAHCVVGYFIGKPATGVTIVPDRSAGTAGLTRFSDLDSVHSVSPIVGQAEALPDADKVALLLTVNDLSASRELTEARFAVLDNQAEVSVVRYRRYIEALAEKLLDVRTLTGEQISMVIERVELEVYLEWTLSLTVCGRMINHGGTDEKFTAAAQV
jgi:hypothetical protein